MSSQVVLGQRLISRPPPRPPNPCLGLWHQLWIRCRFRVWGLTGPREVYLTMLRNVLPIAAVGTLWVSSALGQTPPPTPPRPTDPARVTPGTPTSRTSETGQAYRVKQVLGSKVHIQGDLAIGTV